MKRAWLITRDFLSQPGERNESGTWGDTTNGVVLVRDGVTVGTNWAGLTGLDHPFMTIPLAETVPFRISDDDGEVYYEGVMTRELADSEDIFAPMDDFATPNAGATTLEIRGKDGKWHTV